LKQQLQSFEGVATEKVLAPLPDEQLVTERYENHITIYIFFIEAACYCKRHHTHKYKHVCKCRINRKTTYQQRQQDVKKWDPYIAAMENKNQLKFPLNQQRVVVTSQELSTIDKPETALEKEIQAILKATGMDQESREKGGDDLPMNKLTEEEV
jgi:hypothetical protein